VSLRPRIGVALALQADQHGGRCMGVGLGIAAVLVLSDPEIERVAGHERLDPPPAGRAPVVERQVATDHVRGGIPAPQCEASRRTARPRNGSGSMSSLYL